MQDEQFLIIPTPWIPQRTRWEFNHVRVEKMTWQLATEVVVPISDQMVYMANTFAEVGEEIGRQMVLAFWETIRRYRDASSEP